MAAIKVYEWTDETGVEHLIPDGSCPVCKFCTDIYLDPWYDNRIYLCQCSKHAEASPCKDFVLDESVVDVTKVSTVPSSNTFECIPPANDPEDSDDARVEFTEEFIHKMAECLHNELMSMIFDGIDWEDDDGNEDSKP